jgi:uncharacterized protein DUF6777
MNTRRIGPVVAVVLLVVAGVVVTLAVTKSEQEDIFLEAANSVGQNPFTTSAVVTPTTAEPSPSTTALFGGSGDLTHCDPERLIAFLTDPANVVKAKAWVAALNSDPTLRWGENHSKTKLELTDIASFIHELTPTNLTVDTRVTNYGFKNGKAVGHQALLQKGMAVLVDWNGVPRAKCKCGNPLTPPHKVDHPHYVGKCWPGCHDQPPCSRNCSDTTTTEPKSNTTVGTTTTTRCPQTVVASQCGPPKKTTTTRQPQPGPTTTIAQTTSTAPRTTTTTVPNTTTTCSPNDPNCAKP